MFKQFLILFAIVVVVKSQNNTTNGTTSTVRTDDYINLNRRQHSANIRDYDLQLDTFRQNYAGRVDTINIQLEMLEDSMNQSDQRLNPLELLSDFSRTCVTRYRPLIPTVTSVRTATNACATTANNLVNSLLAQPLNTRNLLQSHYSITFENGITNCNNTHWNSTANYTACVTTVTATTNTFTINNQRTFATQIEAAECSANANVRTALDCSFTVQNSTLSSLAVANTFINRCLDGLDDCSRCAREFAGFSCSDVYYLSKSDVNYKISHMVNVFDGRSDISDCLMLKIN